MDLAGTLTKHIPSSIRDGQLRGCPRRQRRRQPCNSRDCAIIEAPSGASHQTPTNFLSQASSQEISHGTPVKSQHSGPFPLFTRANGRFVSPSLSVARIHLPIAAHPHIHLFGRRGSVYAIYVGDRRQITLNAAVRFSQRRLHDPHRPRRDLHSSIA